MDLSTGSLRAKQSTAAKKVVKVGIIWLAWCDLYMEGPELVLPGSPWRAEFRSRRVMIEAVGLGLRPSLNGVVEKKIDDAQKKLRKLE